MRHRIWTSLLTAGFLFISTAAAQERREPDPLFSSNDVLEITITGPFKTLMRKRPTEEDLPARLSYVDEAGDTVDLQVGLRTRGKYRRQMRVCPFAPIRLNFKKSEMKNTIFEKQDKIKLVGHCRDDSTRYEQVTLKEYLQYRFLNELTDLSFRVRLLRITYVDTERKNNQDIRYGFVIEHKDRLAKRVGLPNIEVRNTSVAALVPDHTNLMSVFQYFIANTDFSLIAGAPDDFCCHNVTLFGYTGQLYYPIIYDFDMAGMTDAPYATPNARFKIRNVRQRLYRGRCANNAHVPASIRMLQEKEDEFYSLVENIPDLTGSSKKSMTALMGSFYKLINNPNAVEKRIIRKCI